MPKENFIMQITFVILGLSALTVAEINCFDKESLRCVAEEYRKHLSDTDFCRTSPSSTKCFLDAAVQCQTGFEEIARTAYLKQVEICTDGTVSNRAVKNDPFCGFDTLVETRKCDMEKVGGLCK
nr:uncharacterized protein LOC107442834 [Parasteatoda tepidariorum]